MLEREQQPFDPGAEADPGSVLTADLLDQAVVTTADADRALRAVLGPDELEDRPGVVVEAADEGGHELVIDPVGIEERSDRVEVLAARVAERLPDLRGVLQGSAHPLVLHIKDLQRARRALVARLVVERVFVRVQPLVEPRDVRGAAVRVADRVQVQRPARDAESPQELRVELDQLGVEGGIVGADCLDRGLVVLAVAALLGRGVAIDRRDGVELLRLWLALQPVLEVGAADRRRRVRAKCERAAPPVFERVHLLLDDIRARTRRARKELGVLEDRRLDAPVAVERAETLDLARDPLPERLFGR